MQVTNGAPKMIEYHFKSKKAKKKQNSRQFKINKGTLRTKWGMEFWPPWKDYNNNSIDLYILLGGDLNSNKYLSNELTPKFESFFKNSKFERALVRENTVS